MALEVLLIGVPGPEFAATAQVLEEQGPVVRAPHPAAALELLAGGAMVPDLIVLLRARPEELTAEAIDALRRVAPLARLVVVVGSWCEGETRSVEPRPGEIRLYWHQAAARLRRELAELAAGRCPAWGLPVTATDEERLLWTERPAAPSRDAHRGTIALVSHSWDMAEWLATALAGQGWHTVHGLPGQGVAGDARLVLWDVQRFGEAELAELAHWRLSAPECAALVLAGFPRPDDERRALAAGAVGLVSKPLSLADLFDRINRHAP